MRIRDRGPGARGLAAGALTMGVLLAAAACSSSGASSGGSSGSSSVINGAGSTFAAPMYQQWAGQYHTTHGTQINYQAIGSGGGISEFTQGIIDFGATDAPMTSAEQASAQAGQGSAVLHIPMIIGAVAICFNEPGISNLKLDGPTLANIYLGTIKKWNDPAIQALNPGVKLPSDPIQPVIRADSSGTSYVVTSYLSAVSPAFASQVGASKAPVFPVGTGATGSSGMAAAIQQTKGAIGYVEYGYAVQAKIPFASLKNTSGQFVPPSTASTNAAAAAATYPTDITSLVFSLNNSSASGAYPIVTPTYILAAQKQKDPAKGKALVAWLEWDLAAAQQAATPSLGYAPLPAKLVALDLAALKTVH
ncbi:MAG TPA: phosphate ABC transporter substrate-binding protein PstS [Streptosporangiaceae bacterium]|nr:phosphate ABC transporter substrate-binding protein PstS [Streptosporangiaceae bacterium]